MHSKSITDEIIIYQKSDGKPAIDVTFENETVWLNQNQLAILFNKGRSTIAEHILNIFKEGELHENVVCRDFRRTTQHGAIANKTQEISVKHYNLDLIISVGFRVNSVEGVRFRQWATERIREYIIKGFTINTEKLKNSGGGNYWKELLDEIRDIRSSEKVLYRQVLDLYATAIDYNPNAKESLKFFKIIQNKIHFAAHGHTASEIIYLRVDSNKPFAGIHNFKGSHPTQAEAMITKNYLDIKELKVLNNLVSAYFDIAEVNAIEEKPMYMKDYIRELDGILKSSGRKLLDTAGNISHEEAIQKVKNEYRVYRAKTLSPVEESYITNIKNIEKDLKKKK